MCIKTLNVTGIIILYNKTLRICNTNIVIYIRTYIYIILIIVTKIKNIYMNILQPELQPFHWLNVS